MSPEPQDVLEQVRAKRGYLLPYHQVLALTEPRLLATYDAWYDALTLAPRALTPAAREIVWIALVAVTRQKVGALHLQRGREAGLDDGAIEDAITLAAATRSAAVLGFAASAWPDFTTEARADARYMALFEAASGALPATDAALAGAVCQAVNGEWAAFGLHLEQAFEAGTTVGEVAEALSFLIHHNGAPTLVAATAAWQERAAAGRVPAPGALETRT